MVNRFSHLPRAFRAFLLAGREKSSLIHGIYLRLNVRHPIDNTFPSSVTCPFPVSFSSSYSCNSVTSSETLETSSFQKISKDHVQEDTRTKAGKNNPFCRGFHSRPATCQSNGQPGDPSPEPSSGGITKYLEDLPRKTFLNALLLQFRSNPRMAENEKFLREQIEEKFEQCMGRHKDLLVDGRANAHLQMAAVVTASYSVLMPWMENDSAAVIEAIKQPAGAAASDIVKVVQKVALFLTWDKMKYASNMLQNMESDYGKAFTFEHYNDDESHEARVTRCLYHSVFEKEGFLELTSIFCAMDRLWFNQLDPIRDGIQFERPLTLAEGGNCCRFIVKKANK